MNGEGPLPYDWRYFLAIMVFNKNFLTNLTKSDKFTLRLFLHNHQIYRKHHVARLVATPEQNKPAILVLLLLKQILIQQNIYLHTKYTKSNKN